MLPGRKDRGDEASPQQELIDTWKLAAQVTTATVSDKSHLVGKTVEEAGLWSTYGVNLLIVAGGRRRPAPPRGARPASPPGKSSRCWGRAIRLRASLRTTVSSWTPSLPSGSKPPSRARRRLRRTGGGAARAARRQEHPRLRPPQNVFGRAHRVALGCRAPAGRFLRQAPVRRRRAGGSTATGNTSDRSLETRASTYSPPSKAKNPTRPRPSPPPSASPAPSASRSPASPSPSA